MKTRLVSSKAQCNGARSSFRSAYLLACFLFCQPSWLDRLKIGLVSSLISSVMPIEGFIRLVFLVGYVWLIGRLPDIRRLYGYHGAEHKTINAYEAGAELTPASVARFPLEHPRCGTAFLLTVVVISILIFTLLPSLTIPVRILSRILLLPIVAGIAYEYIRFTAKFQENPIIRLITKPNLALQRLTTREPDEGMLAVAIAAFEQVMAFEQGQELALVDAAVSAVDPSPAVEVS